LVELDVSNDVGLLGSVVGNDTLVYKLLFAPLLGLRNWVCEFAIVVVLILVLDDVVDLLDSFEDGLGRHESAAVVNDEGAPRLVTICRHFETTPNLHLELFDLEWRRRVEETRTSSKLEQPGVGHGLLDDDVEELVHGLVGRLRRIIYVRRVYHIFSGIIQLNFDGFSQMSSFNFISLFKTLGGPDAFPPMQILPNQILQLDLDSPNDLVELERSEFVGVGIL
jgi:hypothetical protein